ncbi:MAG TPA: GNAT family protein [Pseudolabrys sp.]|nr:GNAT family protein [Pseudolabrys sp.]
MASTKNQPVLLQTKRFSLRSLKPTDAAERWINWLKDPDVMGPLNVPPRQWNVRELMAHISSADNHERYLIGIFDLVSKVQIGFYMIDVDIIHRRATFNAVVGEKTWWGKGVINETRAALLDEFFINRGIEKAVGMPLARNFPAVFNYKAQGWHHEGTLRGHCISLTGGTRLDQYQFGLAKAHWLGLRGGSV